MSEPPSPTTFNDTPNGYTTPGDESEDERKIKSNLRHRIKREQLATLNGTPKKRKSTPSRPQPRKEEQTTTPSSIFLQVASLIYRVINTVILEPLGRAVGEVLKYVLAITVLIVLVIAILRYSLHLVPNLFFRDLSLPLRWLGKVYHVPTTLWCMYVGIGCPVSPPQFNEIKNVTLSANEQVRQASKVINNLDKLSPSRNELMSQSVNIHSIGDAAQWLSNLEDRALVSTHLYKLAEKVKVTGRITTKLESSGKNAMGFIVALYEQLDLKLQGTKEGKYTPQELLLTRENLQREVKLQLEDLQRQIESATHVTDEVYDLSARLGSVLMREKQGIYIKQNELDIAKSSWNAKLRDAIQWDALSKIQRETVTHDLQLMDRALGTVVTTKVALNTLTTHLDSFFNSVEFAQKKHTREIYMGLDVEDLLRSYQRELEFARNRIKEWE